MANYRRQGEYLVKEMSRAEADIGAKRALDAIVERRLAEAREGRVSDTYFFCLRRLAAAVEDYIDYGAIGEERLPAAGQKRNPLRRPVPESVKRDAESVIGLSFMVLDKLEAAGYQGFTPIVYEGRFLPELIWFFLEKGTDRYSDELLDEYLAHAGSREGEMSGAYFRMTKAAAMHVRAVHNTGELYREEPTGPWFRILAGQWGDIAREYDEWALEVRCLSEGAVERSHFYIGSFLETMAGDGVDDVRRASREDVHEARDAVCGGRSPEYMAYSLVYIRSFAAFLEDRYPDASPVWIWLGPGPKIRRKVIGGYSKEQADAIAASVDRETAIGKRDYAIIMLARHTGLRGVDIASLSLPDIDWQARVVRVAQSKTGKELVLPLNLKTCEALYDCILNSRRECEDDAVFVRQVGPAERIKSHSVHDAIAKYAKRVCGPDYKWPHGAHAFRRGLGASMVEAGADLDVVAQALGHSDTSSTRPYVSIALESTRICAAGLGDVPVRRGELM